jgi:hypothetical protein
MAALAPGSPTLNTSDLFEERSTYRPGAYFRAVGWLNRFVSPGKPLPLVLLTAGPGTARVLHGLAGKPALAGCATTRRDSRRRSAAMRSFFFSTGYQLACPELFHWKTEIVVHSGWGGG